MIWNSQCFVNSSNLYEMPNKKWKLMYIQNQLQHPELTKVLENIVENAVTDGFAKNITGKVRFTGAVTFDNIITTNYINNVNLDYIAQDALFKHSSDVKHISCSKTFISPTVLSQGEVLGDFDAFIINGVKIDELNESLVWKNEDAVITGSKILKQNVFVDDLIVEGLVNSVAVNDVVFFENDRPIPNIVFNTLHIKDNLQVQDINGRNLDEFLSKRVRLRGDAQNVSAHVQFAKLNIAGPSFVSKINNISLDEVVFTDVATSDTITGMKVFEKGLKVYGDISAKFLNDFHLQTTYSNSIRKNKDYYISHVVFNNPVQLLNGLYAHAYENQTWLNFYAKPFLDNTFAQEMDTKLNYTFNSIKPYYHYLYLEPSEIRILEPPSKKVETIRPGFLQLSNDVSGEVCYLPQFCPCSVQYTVDIPNQRSISILPGNATHRVFSYHDDGIGINIFTNSISTSAFCSTANEELTYVTWMEPQRETPDSTPIGDITIDQKYYNGYLSDAKFFRDRSSRIFLVLAMYYDKSSDSHDIDSLLLELNMTTRETHIVQYISTRSATTLELLQSPFGTHLVICNAVQNEDIQAYFEIMKYDQENYQFKPVRTVSTEGCGLMASAVFGKEQFIFVGDENYKILRINRYIEQLDMFHYFQSFIYESYLRGLHIFYPQNSKKGEVLLCVTTDNGNFYIYDYTYIEGWKQISTGYLRNVHDVTHFQLNHEEFLFMSSTYKNMVFRIIRQGIP
ncbi:uncharacterized protein LOC113376355 [Ctenocephalides felis]|uniref:uncharacterized protein LOC113376355 n=1 Tax=Ctenocephalides felis TaxID=7515 RepID=UPI000E6E21E4|nr:uncharacterized protein LOC113376355 [Ctenocephalides felis]